MDNGNKFTLDNWISQVDSNEIIIVIGAGFTKNALMSNNAISTTGKIPLWNDLILDVQKKMKLESFDPLLSFDIYRKCYGATSYESLLRDSMPNESLVPGPVHTYLTKIPKVKAIITTNNIDTVLDKTFPYDKTNRIIFDVDVASYYANANNGNIIYLHGHRNYPKSWIFSRTDYEDINKEYPLKTSLCRILFASYPSLFLGFGHSDQDLHSIMRYVNYTVNTYKPPMLSLSVSATNPLLVEYWKGIGLSIARITEDGKTQNVSDELLSALEYINKTRINNLIKKNKISRGFRVEESYMDKLVGLKLDCKKRSGTTILCDYHQSRDKAIIYSLPRNSGIVSVSPYTSKIISNSNTHKLIQRMEKGFVPVGSWSLMPSHRDWLEKGIRKRRVNKGIPIKILIAGIAGLPHFVDTLSLLYKYIPGTVQMEITILDYCIGPLERIKQYVNGNTGYKKREDHDSFKSVYNEIKKRGTDILYIQKDILSDDWVGNAFDIILSHHLVTDLGVENMYKIGKYAENISMVLKEKGILISAQNFKADDARISSFQDVMQQNGLSIVDSTIDFDIYDFITLKVETKTNDIFVDKETLLTIHKKEK